MRDDDPLFRVARTRARRMLEQRRSGYEEVDPSLVVDEVLQTLARIFDFGEQRAALRTRLNESLRNVH